MEAASSKVNCGTEKTLVCIPCYNSESTIVEVVQAILMRSKADILLVDDHSAHPLADFIAGKLPGESRVHVIRPEQKVNCGGGKNLGMRWAADHGYDYCVLVDSDIVLESDALTRLTEFLASNPDQVIVGAAIVPYGNLSQFSDTLINFSGYMPDSREDVSWKGCLAGYTIAINMTRFVESPCELPAACGGDDVLFCKRIQKAFGIERFPLLNTARAIHKHPRLDLASAVRTQVRYAESFFAYIGDGRNAMFRKLPLLHMLTPRFFLMVFRLLQRRRFRDLRYVPVCWFLDMYRATRILRLSMSGYEFPQPASPTALST